MNLMKKVSMMAAAAALAVSLAACSSVPANTVHSRDCGRQLRQRL